MSTVYSVIVDEFGEGLFALHRLVQAFQNSHENPKTRVAAVHSSTLLLAATFEEFVREMAREFARDVVNSAKTLRDLPQKLAETAWKRTLEDLVRRKIREDSSGETLESVAKDAQKKMEAICSFIEGDMDQDIYGSLIHNENNMRPREINSLFKISGLGNLCSEICNEPALQSFFGEDEVGKTHGALLSAVDEFFERRNRIAHSLNTDSSTGPDEILRDIEMFAAFAKGLVATLEARQSRAAASDEI